ncbi:glypican-1 [Puma concolor]|uniref:Glypican-1 n=1 Tax=Puma concolor TaxID=9696 RepID=A0A6P6IHQ1_PUMCO|nr:glypican-1 [Puma concolor]
MWAPVTCRQLTQSALLGERARHHVMRVLCGFLRTVAPRLASFVVLRRGLVGAASGGGLAGASRQVSHPPGGGGLLALGPLATERMAQANGSGQAWLSFRERGLLSIRGTSKLLVGPRRKPPTQATLLAASLHLERPTWQAALDQRPLTKATTPKTPEEGGFTRPSLAQAELRRAPPWAHPHASQLGIGEHLRICPQGYTCCTSHMEENLANRSRAELETALLDSGRALQATLTTQLQNFDGEQATGHAQCPATELLSSGGGSRAVPSSASLGPMQDQKGEGVELDAESTVPLGPECSRAVMKLVYCAHCLGVPGARPCPDYCRNVLKGCLANQADLDAEWRNLLDSMVLITDKFWGPSGAESVIGSVHLWLAEAINALQDNRDTLTAKVIQGCGNPKVNPQSSGPEQKQRRGKLVLQERPPTGSLEKLVSEAKAQLRDAQDFWISLPGMLCSEKMAMSTASDDRCWNGMAKGRYLPEVMGDGLANQINNPEVEVDITKPDMTVRQQIMQLKVMTNRLRSAYNGNDVDFQDASDDSSGSGSGDSCPDDLCGRRVSKKSSSPRTTLTHALPGLSEREGQKTSASGCPRPCVSLMLLLSLVLSAARPTWR